LGPQPIKFKPSQGGVIFGSSISTVGTPPFSSFTLQPGIYQIHLSSGPGIYQQTSDAQPYNNPFNFGLPGVFPADSSFYLQAGLLGGASLGGLVWPMVVRASGSTKFDIVAGDRLLSVGQANSLLQIIHATNRQGTSGDCELVITRLQ
jgi:hypothetical protein